MVVTFYEGLMGLHSMLRGTDAPVVAVGHQFMTDHPSYPLLPGQPLQRIAMKGYTALVGSGAVRRLALSFYDGPDWGDARVTPPLLRPQLFDLVDDTLCPMPFNIAKGSSCLVGCKRGGAVLVLSRTTHHCNQLSASNCLCRTESPIAVATNNTQLLGSLNFGCAPTVGWYVRERIAANRALRDYV